jgi:hypothetical protein
MSAESAIRMLQTAIENVREQCGKDPKCAGLISSLDQADKDAEKILGQPYDQAADTKTEQTGKPDTDVTVKVSEQPRDLKTAGVIARQQFQDRRKAS